MGGKQEKTPYFIAYPAKIVENYRLMSSVLPVDRLYYATKPNGEAPTLSALIAEGANFEIICADEMEQLLSDVAASANCELDDLLPVQAHSLSPCDSFLP